MDVDHLKKIIERADSSREPRIEMIKRISATGLRLGVFASSFNPLTIAHLELMKLAAEAFSLDEILALAGKSNADKMNYECPLEDRLAMLELTLAEYPRISIGVASRGFYVDMIDALDVVYPRGTDLHFIVGFDTFERVLDVENRYTERYYRQFRSRLEAIEHLVSRSRLIVAGRDGSEFESVKGLVERELVLSFERVLYLDFPADLGQLSATAVRKNRREGMPITGLVPARVEEYIQTHGLYIDVA